MFFVSIVILNVSITEAHLAKEVKRNTTFQILETVKRE